ncbi:MAG: DUF2877 domain-containing protein [Elusimicrobiota bacterium]
MIDENLVSIVDKKYFNGPNRILVSDFAISLFQNSEIVKFKQDRLSFSNGVIISLKNAKQWESNVPKISPDIVNTSIISNYLKNYLFVKPSVVEQFKFAVETQNKKLVNYNVDKLVGLGSGLTPAGDDFLAGFISASWFLSEGGIKGIQPVKFFLKNVKINYSKTNFISAAYLRYSIVGRISEVIANTIISITERNPCMSFWLDNLANTGATSGKDTLFGILTAMEIHNACKYSEKKLLS